MSKSSSPVHVVGQLRLRKRGPIWHARYTEGGRRREESLEVTNLQAAQRKARQISDRLERGEYVDPKERRSKRNTTFADFVDQEFLVKYTRWADSTMKSTISTVRMLVREFGEQPIRTITAHQISTYLAHRQEQGLSVASANRYLAALKTILKCAKEWGFIGHSPAESVTMAPEQKKKPNPYTDSELDRLLSALEHVPDKRNIAVVAADTGMRKGELRNLKWSDVDLQKREITVRETKNRDYRTIPMTRRVYEILFDLHGRNTSAKVKSLQVWGTSADIRQLLGRAGKRVGIEGATMHRLRDTFGTRLADNGVPLDRIRRLMGHRSIEMTLRYAETREHHLADAIATLGD